MQAANSYSYSYSSLSVSDSSIADYWTALTNIVELAMAVAGVCFLLWAIGKFDDWWVKRESQKRRRAKQKQMRVIMVIDADDHNHDLRRRTR